MGVIVREGECPVTGSCRYFTKFCVSNTGDSTLDQGAQLHPKFLALHPQFGTMQ